MILKKRFKKPSPVQGLFTADQNVQDNAGSTKTRQNPNGNRYGYECPEERDYFPYWHPTDWKDAAVFVNSIRECSYYRGNSFNRNPKGMSNAASILYPFKSWNQCPRIQSFRHLSRPKLYIRAHLRICVDIELQRR